jgi:hypothetical protein
MLMMLCGVFIAVVLDHEQQVAADISCFFGFGAVLYHCDAGILVAQCLAAFG